MIKVLFSFIKHQSLKFKILLGICTFLFLLLISYSIKLAYANHKLVKAQKKVIENLHIQLEESEDNTTEIITSLKEHSNQTRQKHSDITIKLEEDEKIINNDSITDDDIRVFISKYN